jgi:hypothetical protein
MIAMWTEWLGGDSDGRSLEELERSMEHEIEGMLELDELELLATFPQPQFPAELAILEDVAVPLSAGRCGVRDDRAERAGDQL